jgi:2-polyprenyl-6-methoxyphenol hydroxylase-like FAD-dependent oxidoreductase
MGLANSASTSSIDVLIIGAGPVGLFLANECARRSLRWRIIEQPAARPSAALESARGARTPGLSADATTAGPSRRPGR